MKSNKLVVLAVLSLCVLFIGTESVYAARGPGPGDRDFISDWDKDGDGRVSRMELPVPNSHFNRLDKNSDGFIDKDEAVHGPPPKPMDFISDWDKNGDGRVSRMELPFPNSHFDRLDNNSDGFIGLDEAPQGPPPGHGHGGPGQHGPIGPHGGPGQHGPGHGRPGPQGTGPDGPSIK